MSNPLFVHATLMPPQAAALAEARAPEAHQRSASSVTAASEFESSNGSATAIDVEKNTPVALKPARRRKANMRNCLRKCAYSGIFLWILLLIVCIAIGAMEIKRRLEDNAALDEVRKAAATIASMYGVDRREV